MTQLIQKLVETHMMDHTVAVAEKLDERGMSDENPLPTVVKEAQKDLDFSGQYERAGWRECRRQNWSGTCLDEPADRSTVKKSVGERGKRNAQDRVVRAQV